MTASEHSLFDRIEWRDPISGAVLEPIVLSRTPAGVPITGALRVAGTSTGYPIVDCVARLTPELAIRHRRWLEMAGLEPAGLKVAALQPQDSVDSFGFQWSWNANPRTDADLRDRVATKFGTEPRTFDGKLVVDAGAGAGDQSRYILDQGGAVLSVDLSSAIDVVSRKLRLNGNWFGVQGDVAKLPVADQQFDIVYCEGVIQHTADSFATVEELKRVLKVGGRMHAAHYIRSAPTSLMHGARRRLTTGYYGFLRRRFNAMKPHTLLLICGILAALNYVPIVGWMLRRAGIVLHSELMPGLLTTWTNTYDLWGSHEFQRFITHEEFLQYFERAGGMRVVFDSTGVIAATREA